MKKPFHSFITTILNQIDGTTEEKMDIYEEIEVHLELNTKRYMEEGFDQKKAEQLAMTDFGESHKIGNDMQEAMYPMRKKLLLFLAITSIAFSVTLYITYLIAERDAEIIWLLLSIGTSSGLLLFALQVFPSIDQKRWINSVLIGHIFTYLLGTLIATNMIHIFTPFLTIYGITLLLVSIILIYRTTIIDFTFHSTKNVKQAKQLHFINITAGIIITGATLFFLWGILIFSETFPPFLLAIFIPFIIWLVAYYIQMNLVSHNKRKIAYTIAMIPFIFIVIIVIFFIWNAIPKGVFV